MTTLAGRRILITGAARGIGALTRSACATAALMWRSLGLEPELLGTSQRGAAARRGSRATLPTARRSRTPLPPRSSRLGGLDVAIANAGIGAQMTLVDGDAAVWTRRSP